MALDEIEALIRDGVLRLTASSHFASWRDSQEFSEGDIALVNNSFVFRDVKTTKSEAYLALVSQAEGAGPVLSIARGTRINAEFKRLAAASSNLPVCTPLPDALPGQVERLGHLVFLLIGQIQDNEQLTHDLQCAPFATALWNPTLPVLARIEGDCIVVSRTDDEEAIWNAVTDELSQLGAPVPDELRSALGISLDKLQEQAVARVTIPVPGAEIGPGITDAILTVVREQRDEYASALSACASSSDGTAPPINQVLRIAYNFASDATTFLRLIVSVCDLKPIVLWGTIAEHVALATAFDALPWSRSKYKASLKGYQQAIGDARNSAFHNLFPFRKSLRVSLPETALGSPELQIFSEHTKKTQNQLTYQDRELVDVLTEFTRARERNLPMTFWIKNLEVMNATIALFERTSEFVKALARAREP